MISLQNVSSKREGKYLLKNINWEVVSGENWVLFGLNGSGKTTLLNIITGYLWPTTGKVTVFEKEFGTYPLFELRKQIGFVSSSLNEIIPEYDYAENIVLSGKYASFGLHEDPEQSDIDFALSLMEKFDSSKLIHRTYETLSQGEKQKVLIMRALMAKPKLLILDEPCIGLDVIAREQVLQLINTIGQDVHAPTLLYVTHHIEEIMPAFDHVLLLRNGEMYQKGTVDHILTTDVMSRFLEKDIEIQHTNHRYYLKF